MNKISASFNFPSDFFWGINLGAPVDRENILQLLFRLQDMNVRAVYVSVPWAKCEPLKDHFDEEYIESVRQRLIRIRSLNIMPVIVPDTLSTPPWLNLDHAAERNREIRSGSGFIRHLAEATIAFTDYFGVLCPSRRPLLPSADSPAPHFFTQTLDHIRSLLPGVKAGIILPEEFTEKQNMILRTKFGFLKNAGADFIGLPASERVESDLNMIYSDIRIPVMFISDGLAGLDSAKQAEKLTDQVFNVWQLYQKGFPVIGYLSEINTAPGDPGADSYTQICKTNSLQIATDTDHLSERWIRFLKD